MQADRHTDGLTSHPRPPHAAPGTDPPPCRPPPAAAAVAAAAAFRFLCPAPPRPAPPSLPRRQLHRPGPARATSPPSGVSFPEKRPPWLPPGPQPPCLPLASPSRPSLEPYVVGSPGWTCCSTLPGLISPCSSVSSAPQLLQHGPSYLLLLPLLLSPTHRPAPGHPPPEPHSPSEAEPFLHLSSTQPCLLPVLMPSPSPSALGAPPSRTTTFSCFSPTPCARHCSTEPSGQLGHFLHLRPAAAADFAPCHKRPAMPLREKGLVCPKPLTGCPKPSLGTKFLTLLALGSWRGNTQSSMCHATTFSVFRCCSFFISPLGRLTL